MRTPTQAAPSPGERTLDVDAARELIAHRPTAGMYPMMAHLWDAIGEVARLREQVARHAAQPHRPSITSDPRVGFGRPCVTGTGTRADVVAEHVWAGESPDEVARDFDITRADVLWCCAWWTAGQHRSRPRQRERWQLWRRWAIHAGLVFVGHRPGVELCDPDDYEPG